jgi:hypothetical protein
MKYLKSYNKLFESTYEEIEQYLKDIFLELQDVGFNVRIKNSTGKLPKFLVEYTVTLSNKVFKLSDIFELILTSESYMNDNDWFIRSIKFRTYDGNDRFKNEWFTLNHDDIQKLKNPDNLRKEVTDINYLEIEFKLK